MYYPGGGGVYRSRLAAPGLHSGNPHNANTAFGSGGIHAIGAAERVQLVPETPTGDDKYYCKGLDGGFTLQTTNFIMNHCQPGQWRVATKTGFPYWERHIKE